MGTIIYMLFSLCNQCSISCLSKRKIFLRQWSRMELASFEASYLFIFHHQDGRITCIFVALGRGRWSDSCLGKTGEIQDLSRQASECLLLSCRSLWTTCMSCSACWIKFRSQGIWLKLTWFKTVQGALLPVCKKAGNKLLGQGEACLEFQEEFFVLLSGNLHY